MDSPLPSILPSHIVLVSGRPGVVTAVDYRGCPHSPRLTIKVGRKTVVRFAHEVVAP
jgi:hypothetical protein